MKTNIPFTKFIPFFFVTTILLSVVSVGNVLLQWKSGTIAVGIDFAGGVETKVKFAAKKDIAELRSVLEKAGGIDIQEVIGAERGLVYLLRMKSADNTAEKDAAALALTARYGAGSFEILEKTSISGTMSKDNLIKSALIVLLSWVLVFIYIIFRFEMKYAIGAVVALLHDVTICFGFISIAGIEWNILTLTAVLTIIGYSSNDTIIIFDRVRENAELKGAFKSYKELIDVSVNQTLSRTLGTAAVVILVTLAIIFFGGPVIHNFGKVMLVGLIAGTYSSVFVACQVAIMWTAGADRAKAKRGKDAAVTA